MAASVSMRRADEIEEVKISKEIAGFSCNVDNHEGILNIRESDSVACPRIASSINVLDFMMNKRRTLLTLER